MPQASSAGVISRRALVVAMAIPVKRGPAPGSIRASGAMARVASGVRTSIACPTPQSMRTPPAIGAVRPPVSAARKSEWSSGRSAVR